MPFKSDEERRAYQRKRYARLKREKVGKAAGNPQLSHDVIIAPKNPDEALVMTSKKKTEGEGTVASREKRQTEGEGDLLGRILEIVIILGIIGLAFAAVLILFYYWG